MRLLVELTRDGAQNPKPLEDLDREIVEIDQLVSELLAASRMDFSALSPRDLDAKELAQSAMERAGVTKDVLVTEDAPDFTVRGDATLLSRAMSNLLENAKRHGGGVASVRMGVRAGKVFFEVDDDGEGFAKGEEDRAFEPFRKGRSSTGDDKGSVGFGLALVRRIAEAHSGRAYARNRQPRGARVGLEIARTAE
jgi:signal transduction histidine kinase